MDYSKLYNHALDEAKSAGFLSIGDAIRAVGDAKSETAAPVSAPIASTPELQQLKALALAATPGPWTYWYEGGGDYPVVSQTSTLKKKFTADDPQGDAEDDAETEDEIVCCSRYHCKGTHEAMSANAQYLSKLSPEVVLDLIARIERAAAPAPADGVRWDLFPGYLIDHCEGSMIYEESLQVWVAAMLKDPDYLRVAAESVAASPAAASGDELPELPVPLEIVWPELHRQALGCGIEDRGIHDRYEAAEHGWECGVERAIECVPELLYEEATVLEIQRAAYELGKSRAAVSAATKPTAELSGITRWTERNSTMGVGAWMEATHDGEFVKLADVQSLLATKPAAAPDVPKIVQEALDIALDLAIAEADHVHEAYKGYKQHKHDAADRDVETIKRAIDAINPAAPMASDDAVIEAREQALEEAALICDQQAKEPEAPERASYCADEIRALERAAQPTMKGAGDA